MNDAMWYERVTELRALAADEPHRAGTEALRLFEDWLFEQASDLGFGKERGGMREFVDFVAKRGRLSQSEAARARRFADVRNCVSHRAGLLIGPALADELLDFVEALFRSEAMDAEHLMTRQPHTVQESDDLHEARDWMLAHGVSRLPVVRRGRVVGLLTNRDILFQAAQPAARDTLTVGQAMGADGLETVPFVARRAPYDEVLAQLQKPNVAALLVTEHGRPNEALLGIISVSNILPKL